MTDLIPLVFVVVTAVAAVLLTHWVIWAVRRWRAKRPPPPAAVVEELTVALQAAAEEIATLRSEVEVARTQRDALRDRIAAILGERDQWRQLYYRQVTEHGNAQTLMMRELAKYELHLQAIRNGVAKAESIEEAREVAKKKPPVDYGMLNTIATEFAEGHSPDEEAAVQRLKRLDERLVRTPEDEVTGQPKG